MSKQRRPSVRWRELEEREVLDSLLEFLVPMATLVHLWFAPFTKVEESFNMQATHDISMAGVPLTNSTAALRENYDHFTFPGAVPRTFFGSLVLALISSPLLHLAKTGVDRQLTVRGILALINSASIIYFSRRAAAAYDRWTARWYLLLQVSQFHLMYYASRTLPNMLAFPLTTYAMARLLSTSRLGRAKEDVRVGICCFVFAGVVFRGEIAVLLAMHLVPVILTWQLSIPDVAVTGIAAAAASLAVAVPIDTFFWQSWPKPMWAELSGFLFNAIGGKASEWGTSPWWYYFVNSLPKLLLNPVSLLLLLPVGATVKWKQTWGKLIGPSLGYVAAYSMLPHKEWRFIIYVVPSLTLAAGLGAARIFKKRHQGILKALLALVVCASVALSFAISGTMLFVSRLNYPGGIAIMNLDRIITEASNINIHMDVLTCMTGATRFLQDSVNHPTWNYLKTEDKETLSDRKFWEDMDILVHSNLSLAAEGDFGDVVIAVGTVWGYAGVKLLPLSEHRWRDYTFGGRRVAALLSKYTPAQKWPVAKMGPMIHVMWNPSRKLAQGEEMIVEKDLTHF